MKTPKLYDYVCLDCGEHLQLPLDLLQNDRDAIRVTCDGCGKDFMMGMKETDERGKYDAFTYDLFDGKAMLPHLRDMFNCVRLPVSAIDEMLKHAQHNRWEKFLALTYKYRKQIEEHKQLTTYLKVNMVLPE